MTEQAQHRLGEVVEKAESTVGKVTNQAKRQATSQLDSQKYRAVDGLEVVAEALRQTGQRLQDEQQAPIGRYVDRAAERLDTVTDYLREHDAQEIVSDTEDLARRQPGLFLSGAVALGFVVGRFLMSSGERAAARRAGPTGSVDAAQLRRARTFDASTRAPSVGGYAPTPTSSTYSNFGTGTDVVDGGRPTPDVLEE